MNRRAQSVLVLVAISVAGPALAQWPLGLHPDVTTLVSRGSLGNAAGELLQAFPTAILRGLGEGVAGASLSGLRARVQDTNGASAETFVVIVRGGDDLLGPSAGPAGRLAAIGPIATPTAPAIGPIAWQMSVAFATPLAIPRDGFLAAGLELTARQAPVDSLFVHAVSAGVAGEHPSAPDLGWQVPLASGLPSHPNGKLAFRIDLLLPASSFRVANVPGTGQPALFGLGGAFPDTTAMGPATQGIAFSCAHAAGAQGTAFVFAAFAFDPAPGPVPGIAHRSLLEPSTLIRAALVIGPTDGRVIPYITPGLGLLPPGLGARVVFQALVIDGAAAEFTNAFATTLL